ncbi:MAG: hypothetical protein NPIRA02_05020 [Nitrospirales bacterium]|nr:MAG: hypothetical protein NPIRA02_05020 [Nitrospirales bacterium]
MHKKKWVMVVVCAYMLMAVAAYAGTMAQIDLTDGSRVFGEILEMTEGKLSVKTAFGDDEPILIYWSEVVGLTSEEPITFELQDGMTLTGIPTMDEAGNVHVQTELLKRPIPVSVDSIRAVNPPEKKAVVYTGNINFGGAINSGNTKQKNASFVGELIARSERLRLTILGRWIYGEDRTGVNARNSFGTIKLDFFITKRFYAYSSAIFEQDTFQDLQLRTSINAGPGYQIIDQGDFSSPYFHDMQLSGEIGLGFFNEDFKIAQDQNYVTGRWAIDFLWPVLPTVTLFHQHQGFPSLEDSSDFYVTSQQGIRLNLWENFVSSLQVNWRYDNTPSPGFKKKDVLYLLTLGYAFVS